jgi:tetratricopeptide (TPR) repeat protein
MTNFKQESYPMPVNSHTYRSTAFDKPNTLFKKLHVIVIILAFFFYHDTFSQGEKIDSLKKVLPLLHDSARIDCLNELSRNCLSLIYSGELRNDSTQYYTDASQYYTALAFNDAIRLNYIHGIAEALSYKGELEDLSDNFAASEKLYRESLNWYKKTNKKRLAETYSDLGFSLYAQSFFTEGIKNLDTAYVEFKKIGDQSGMFWSTFFLGHIYEESGNYEKAFELDSKGLDLAIQNNNDEFRRAQSSHMAWLFIDIEDYKTAEEYFRQAYTNIKSEPLYMANLFTGMQQYDSAKYYYNLTDTSTRNDLRKYLAGTGEYYFAQKEYTKALRNFLRSLEYNKISNDRNQVMRTLIDVAKTYLALGNNSAAYQYARQGLDMAIQTGAKQFIRDGNQILYSIYDARHKTDSIYYYYRAYITMRDSILNDKVKAKLIAYGPRQKIELLTKEKEIQLVQLQKESLWKKVLLIGIIVLIFIAVIIVRIIILKRKNEAHKRELAENELQIQKLESEKKEEALKQQAIELEMQALRAQMNPHFIFNSLNSINRFILKNQSSEATEYLTKFSRLIRMILNSSANTSVSLAEDLEALQLYLELERLRCEEKFCFEIKTDPELDTDFVQVPPMLLQPFVENAIWHGLMNKEGDGHLLINIQQEVSTLVCTITDDGIGRKKAAELINKSYKHKSMGMKISMSRLAIMYNDDRSIVIRDLVDADGRAVGMEVMLKIPAIQ